MAIYVVSFVISREKVEGTEVMPFSQVITTSFPDPLFAVEFVKGEFPNNQRYTDGWRILGDPVVIEFFQESLKDFLQYASFEPKEKTPHSHLKVVK